MDFSKGYIPVPRSIQDHWLWNDNDESFTELKAWLDLYMLANYSAHKFRLGNEIIEVEAGTVITSMLKLGRRWNWDRKTVRNFLDLLERDQLITKTITKQRTTITIVNYGINRDTGTTKRTTKGQRNEQRRDNETDINNNEKNEKNDLLSMSDGSPDWDSLE